MKRMFILGAATLAAGLLAGQPTQAFAQSDRTLGVNCTVAGHIHCGENGPIYGSGRWHRHHRRHVQRMSSRISER